MRTPRLPVVDWTDASADLNGLVRFTERRNLVTTCVPSHLRRSLPVEREGVRIFACTVHPCTCWCCVVTKAQVCLSSSYGMLWDCLYVCNYFLERTLWPSHRRDGWFWSNGGIIIYEGNLMFSNVNLSHCHLPRVSHAGPALGRLDRLDVVGSCCQGGVAHYFFKLSK